MPRNKLSLVLENPNIPADVLIPRDEDVARMKHVIETDSLLVPGKLVCQAAGHCALGALLFATGIPNVVLAHESGSPFDFSRDSAQRLYDWYRLDSDVANMIVSINDTPALTYFGVSGYNLLHPVQHEPGALDPELVGIAESQYAPTQAEITARRQAILDAIDFGIGTQRAFGVQSRWPQFEYSEYWAEQKYDYHRTWETPRRQMNAKFQRYSPSIPEVEAN